MPEQQQYDAQLLEQTRREISKLVGEIEKLANTNVPEAEFFGEFLRRVCTALAAYAGAIWLKTPHGNLQLQFQINLQSVGINADEETRKSHDDLMRYALGTSKATIVAPHSGPGDMGDGPKLINPTNFLLVLAPVVMDEQTVGVIEVIQEPQRRAAAQAGYAQFLSRISGELTTYLKNRQLRAVLDQQQLWDHMEGYIRSVHGGLHPKQVSYLIANDGKKLIGCERVSVALKHGKKTRIEAISGQDVVERKSNLVRRMAELAGRVINHGENLIYQGVIEEHWPRDICLSLEGYLHESPSKLIIITPIADTREFGSQHKAKAALVVEMIEDAKAPAELAGRVDVVSRHGATALYNALEHHRIPLLPVAQMVGNLTYGLRTHLLPKVIVVTALLAATVAGLILIPWPMRLEGKGALLPEVRRKIYSPRAGLIKSLEVNDQDETDAGTTLAVMTDPNLERDLLDLESQKKAAERTLQALENQRYQKSSQDPKLPGQISEQKQKYEALSRQIDLIKRQLKTLELVSPIRGKVMDWKLQEKLLGRPVDQGQVLMEVADVDGPWVLEIDLPESVVSHIARAMRASADNTLPATYVLSASPDRTYNARLTHLATQAVPKEQENVVEAKLQLDTTDELPSFTKGAEVRVKIDCGPQPVGYVLFRELIDFVREYVFF